MYGLALFFHLQSLDLSQRQGYFSGELMISSLPKKLLTFYIHIASHACCFFFMWEIFYMQVRDRNNVSQAPNRPNITIKANRIGSCKSASEQTTLVLMHQPITFDLLLSILTPPVLVCIIKWHQMATYLTWKLERRTRLSTYLHVLKNL